jgi:hypothetical protein
MEPEGSLPHSQELATGPYPGPDAVSPHLPPYFLQIYSNTIFPSTPRSSGWFFASGFFDQNSVRISHLPHVYYMPRPSHPP